MLHRFDIAALGLTQIVGYGTLYYAFGILAPAMARDFGWPSSWVFGAFSAALLVGGVAAPQAGRWIDRHGAGRVMSIGSLAAALALGLCAVVPSGRAFVPALIGAEVAAVLVQYGAAFPLLVERRRAAAQRSIVQLTLIAGFASTIFWPLTTWLHGILGWREVYLVFALCHLAICLPIHLLLSKSVAVAEADDRVVGAAPIVAAEPPLARHHRDLGFRAMVVAFALQSFLASAVLVHMLPVLAALGLGPAGVALGSLFGPAQVASRLLAMAVGRNLSQGTLAAISAGLLPIAVVVLLVTSPSLAGAMLFACLFGMGNGLASIVGGTLPLSLFGDGGYGAGQGQVVAVRLIVGSAAPFVFALLTEAIGVRAALGLTAAIGAGAVLALLAIARLDRVATPAEDG